MRLLVRLYPRLWRERYGAELAALVEDAGGLGPAAFGNLVAGAVRERLREGAIVVAPAWALFVAAGMVVQKQSEHWQGATPPGARAVPRAAFDAFVAGAGGATVVALVAAALALPAALRSRAFSRRSLVRAALATVVAAISTGGVVWWAHGASRPQAASWAIGIAWVLVLATTLATWTSLVVGAARRVELPPSMRRIQAWLVAGLAVAMTAMTASMCIWWASLARSAPAVVPALDAPLLAAAAAMALASVVGVAGARRALARAS